MTLPKMRIKLKDGFETIAYNNMNNRLVFTKCEVERISNYIATGLAESLENATLKEGWDQSFTFKLNDNDTPVFIEKQTLKLRNESRDVWDLVCLAKYLSVENIKEIA